MAIRDWIDGALLLLRGAWAWFIALPGRLFGGGETPAEPDVLARPPADAGAGAGGDGAPVLQLDGINVYRRGNILYWRDGDLSLDYDGAPNAYAPDGHGTPLDKLANAGKPGNWWGIATDDVGQPLVQGPGEPYPGYYISTTALSWPGQSRTSKYVDSTQISFLSLPPAFKDLGARLGDLALVSSSQTGASRWALWADVGPRKKLGEGSQQLARALGVLSSAALRKSGIDVSLYAGSGDGRPHTEDEIQALGQQIAASQGAA